MTLFVASFGHQLCPDTFILRSLLLHKLSSANSCQNHAQFIVLGTAHLHCRPYTFWQEVLLQHFVPAILIVASEKYIDGA